MRSCSALGITSVREVIQVKRHRRAIQREGLDALRGCLHRFQAVRGRVQRESGAGLSHGL